MYIRVYVYVCRYVRVCIYVCIYGCIYVYMYMYVFLRVHVCIRVVCMCTCNWLLTPIGGYSLYLAAASALVAHREEQLRCVLGVHIRVEDPRERSPERGVCRRRTPPRACAQAARTYTSTCVYAGVRIQCTCSSKSSRTAKGPERQRARKSERVCVCVCALTTHRKTAAVEAHT